MPSCLQSRHSTNLIHTSGPFCFGYFGNGVFENYLLGLASNCNPPDLSLPIRTFFFFGSTGISVQGLMLARQSLLLLEPLHQTCF
jgi:hypothetical protein